MRNAFLLLLAFVAVASAQTYDVSTTYFATNFIDKASTNTTQFKTNVFDARFYNKPSLVLGVQCDGVDSNGVLTVDLKPTWDYYLTNYLSSYKQISVTNSGIYQNVTALRIDMENMSGLKPYQVRYTGTNNITNAFLYSVGKGYTKDRQ